MSFLSNLFGAGDAVKAIGDTIDNLVTSDDERLERKNELAKAQQQYDLEIAKLDAKAMSDQVDINKIDATSQNWFQNAWRPFIGWVCGFALAYASIGEPLARFVALTFFDFRDEFPKIDTTITMQILLGMLGLSGMRSYDKIKGTDTKK
jgi:Holin of 3TMs, for gene-transfer release